MSEGIAQGLYLEASAIDHSCVPNAVWSYEGSDVVGYPKPEGKNPTFLYPIPTRIRKMVPKPDYF